MALYNEILPEFKRLGAQLQGISVDGVWCHAAFARDRNLHFPLLADFEPKGAVGRKYGVYRQDDGTSERALFVSDSTGVIAWSYVSPLKNQSRRRWYPLGARRSHLEAEDSEVKTQSPLQLRLPVSQRDHIRGKPDAPVTLVEYESHPSDF
jgi:hypothetical protein